MISFHQNSWHFHFMTLSILILLQKDCIVWSDPVSTTIFLMYCYRILSYTDQYNFFYWMTFYQFSEDLHQWNFPILHLFGMIKEKINFVFLVFLYHFDICIINCMLISSAAIVIFGSMSMPSLCNQFSFLFLWF